MEQVNLAFRVFNTSGAPLTAPTAFNQFFGVAPAIIRATGVRGDFLSDPRCNFDVATRRWFMTILQLDPPGICAVGPFSSSGPLRAGPTFLAVSQGADPTGDWNFQHRRHR